MTIIPFLVDVFDGFFATLKHSIWPFGYAFIPTDINLSSTVIARRLFNKKRIPRAGKKLFWKLKPVLIFS